MPRRSNARPGHRTNTSDDKRARFLRNIDRRMGEIRQQLDWLANMAGSNYKYSQAEAQQILDKLDMWVTHVKAEFNKTSRPKLEKFSLIPTEW